MIKLNEQEKIKRKRASQRTYYYNNIEEQRKKARLKNIKRRKENPLKCREEGKRYYYTKKGIFNFYKKNAKKRNLNFKLNFEMFENFLYKPCYYCSEISKGIDRINSEIGYEVENIVSCCTICNRAKSNLSIQSFLDKIKKIYNTLLTPNPEKII